MGIYGDIVEINGNIMGLYGDSWEMNGNIWWFIGNQWEYMVIDGTFMGISRCSMVIHGKIMVIQPTPFHTRHKAWFREWRQICGTIERGRWIVFNVRQMWGHGIVEPQHYVNWTPKRWDVNIHSPKHMTICDNKHGDPLKKNYKSLGHSRAFKPPKHVCIHEPVFFRNGQGCSGAILTTHIHPQCTVNLSWQLRSPMALHRNGGFSLPSEKLRKSMRQLAKNSVLYVWLVSTCLNVLPASCVCVFVSSSRNCDQEKQ